MWTDCVEWTQPSVHRDATERRTMAFYSYKALNDAPKYLLKVIKVNVAPLYTLQQLPTIKLKVKHTAGKSRTSKKRGLPQVGDQE